MDRPLHNNELVAWRAPYAVGKRAPYAVGLTLGDALRQTSFLRVEMDPRRVVHVTNCLTGHRTSFLTIWDWQRHSALVKTLLVQHGRTDMVQCCDWLDRALRAAYFELVGDAKNARRVDLSPPSELARSGIVGHPLCRAGTA